MPKISPMTVIVAYDIEDDDVRDGLREYLVESLGARRRTYSVYEFVYDPPATPEYGKIMRTVRKMIDPDEDRVYLWDIDDDTFRRIAVHRLSFKQKHGG